MKNTTKIGLDAEAKACEYLDNIGYKIIERNYRNRFCEIDIICANDEYICLVEVKYRKNDLYGGGFGAIDSNKQQRLQRAFEYWLAENQDYSDLQPRIDVVSVDESGKIEYIENAI
jgi:putative endonuclease